MKKFSFFSAFALLGLAISTATVAIASNNSKEIHAESPLANATLSSTYAWYEGAESNLYDDDLTTFYWVKDSSASTYLQFTFDTPIELNDISIYFEYADFLKNGYVSYCSDDNENFMTIDQWHISDPIKVSFRAYGVSVKKLRIGALDNNDGKWTKFNEIKINQGLYSDDLVQKISFGNFAENYLQNDLGVTSLNYMLDNNQSTYARFSGKQSGESAPNPYIQFDFKASTLMSSIGYVNCDLRGTTNDRVVGSVFKYLDSSSGEYVTFPESILYPSKTTDTYDYQLLDLRYTNVYTTSIRMEITDFAGWIIAGDFFFNEREGSLMPIYSVEVGEVDPATKIYAGNTENLVDPYDTTTYVWFNGRIKTITLDMRELVHVENIKYQTGKRDSTDAAYGDDVWMRVKSSTDGNTFTYIEETTAISRDMDLSSSPVLARYIQLEVDGSEHWHALTYFVAEGISHSQYSDHYMARFNNQDGHDIPSVTPVSNLQVPAFDITSNATWTASYGKYDAGNKVLQLGRYGTQEEVIGGGWSVNKEDSSIYAEVLNETNITREYNLVMVSDQYFSDIQDISIYWNELTECYYNIAEIRIAYLKDTSSTWTLLRRDDGDGGVGYDNYRINIESGTGVKREWNAYGALAGNYMGTSLPKADGDFATNLVGQNARIAIIFSTNLPAYNFYLSLSAITINRVKAVKSLVDRLDNFTWVCNAISEEGNMYHDLMDIAGYKMLDAHADLLNVPCSLEHGRETTYYAQFKYLYEYAMQKELPARPTSNAYIPLFKEDNGMIVPLIAIIAIGTLAIAGYVIYRKRRA